MISILMPVYNAELYLQECIDSIINQSFTNWELIAVDDFSTDGSLKLLKQYESSNSRIKIFKNKEKGIIPALSLAFEKANGHLISRMDADDIMATDKLELLFKGIEKHPNAITTSKVQYFSEKGIGDGYANYESWLNSLTDEQNHYDSIYRECVLPSPNWLMSKENLMKLGGFKSLNYPEDYDLCFKAYKQGVQIIGLEEVLHFWRDYPERTSRNDPNYADNRFLEMKVKYFLECDYNSESTLVIWGAGKKGKQIAKLLIAQKVPFEWVTNNSQKLNVPIYDVSLKSQTALKFMGTCQVIIAIAQKEAAGEIEKELEILNTVQSYAFC